MFFLLGVELRCLLSA